MVAEELTFAEFSLLADRLKVDQALRQELYPMVRDLRGLADRLNALVPEMHGEIPVSALSGAANEGER